MEKVRRDEGHVAVVFISSGELVCANSGPPPSPLTPTPADKPQVILHRPILHQRIRLERESVCLPDVLYRTRVVF